MCFILMAKLYWRDKTSKLTTKENRKIEIKIDSSRTLNYLKMPNITYKIV